MDECLVAPCGMNCALCVSYQAGVHDINRQGFHRKVCPGCIPRGEHCLHMGDTCPKLAAGAVRFCFLCGDFPCKRLKALDRRYRTKYHMSMVDNLLSIRDRGMDVFLADQAAAWRCPGCGGTVCCHNGLCLGCDLETLRQNKGYRWGEG